MRFRFEVVFNFSFTLHINSLSSRACWDLLSLGWLRSIRGCRRLTLLRRNLMLDNLHTRNYLLWGCNMSWFIIFFYWTNLKQKINVHYYSFKIFLHLWLARIPPIILHDQANFDQIWETLAISGKMTSAVQAIARKKFRNREALGKRVALAQLFW